MKRTQYLLGLLPLPGAALWLATSSAHAALLGRGNGSGHRTHPAIVPAHGGTTEHPQAGGAPVAAIHTQGSATQGASVAPTVPLAHARTSMVPAQAHHLVQAPIHTGAPLHLPSYSPITTASPGALDGGAILLLAGKFAVVLLLLFVCLRVLKAIMPGVRGNGGRGGAMVLHSEPIGDKQRVCLLDLHDRLELVGISATGMTALTTVEDADHVAMLRERYSAKPMAPAREEAASAGPSFAATLAAAALTAARSSRDRSARPSAPARPTVDAHAENNPSLERALEAMRAVRQKVARQ